VAVWDSPPQPIFSLWGAHLLTLATVLPLLPQAVPISTPSWPCSSSLCPKRSWGPRDRAWLHPIIVSLLDLTQPDQKGLGIWYADMAPSGLGWLA
jgi:hypothetical protein